MLLVVIINVSRKYSMSISETLRGDEGEDGLIFSLEGLLQEDVVGN